MKSGFVELVMKVAKSDRRTVIVPGYKKLSILNSFKYTTLQVDSSPRTYCPRWRRGSRSRSLKRL